MQVWPHGVPLGQHVQNMARSGAQVHTAFSLVLHLSLQRLRTVGAGQSRQTVRDGTGVVLITGAMAGAGAFPSQLPSSFRSS